MGISIGVGKTSPQLAFNPILVAVFTSFLLSKVIKWKGPQGRGGPAKTCLSSPGISFECASILKCIANDKPVAALCWLYSNELQKETLRFEFTAKGIVSCIIFLKITANGSMLSWWKTDALLYYSTRVFCQNVRKIKNSLTQRRRHKPVCLRPIDWIYRKLFR